MKKTDCDPDNVHGGVQGYLIDLLKMVMLLRGCNISPYVAVSEDNLNHSIYQSVAVSEARLGLTSDSRAAVTARLRQVYRIKAVTFHKGNSPPVTENYQTPVANPSPNIMATGVHNNQMLSHLTNRV